MEKDIFSRQYTRNARKEKTTEDDIERSIIDEAQDKHVVNRLDEES